MNTHLAARTAASAARARKRSLEHYARTTRELASTLHNVERSLETLYYTPIDRLRMLGGLAGIGVAAASLATGAPAYLAAPRLLSNLYTITRIGRRVRATRDAGLGLSEALNELLA